MSAGILAFSFAAGVPILTATVRSQNVLNVQAPARGVATNFTEFTQTGVSPFTLNGQPYQIGQVGVLERLFSTGEGTNIDPNPIAPKSFTLAASNAVVTGVPGSRTSCLWSYATRLDHSPGPMKWDGARCALSPRGIQHKTDAFHRFHGFIKSSINITRASGL